MIGRLQKSMSEKDKGFTLVELLVVVIIIGVLAGIAIPLFLNQRQKAADASIKSDLRNAATTMETYYIENNSYTGATSALFKASDDVTLSVAVAADGKSYCINGDHPGGDVANGFNFASSAGTINEGNCPATA